MRTLILAAGEGVRLRPHTLDRPKCLVPLAGRVLLEWQLAALRSAGCGDVTVIGGFHHEKFAPYGLPVLVNERWQTTNMVVSLFTARALMDRDFLVSYGDIVYEPAVVCALRDCPAPIAVVVDNRWFDLWAARAADPLADAESLRLDDAGHIIDIGRKIKSRAEAEAQYIGLLKFSGEGRRAMQEVHDALASEARAAGEEARFDKMFMTDFLRALIERGHPITAVRIDGGWIEVDSLTDLALYEDLHARGELGRFVRLG